MSRQRTRHFAVALALSVVVTAITAAPAVAGCLAPPLSSKLNSAIAQSDVPQRIRVQSAAPNTSREVFGFALASSLSDPTVGYPSWKFNLLSTVAFFGLHVDTAGHFVDDNGWTVWNSSALTNLVSIAHQHGVKVVVTIVLQDFSSSTPNMCAGLKSADATVAQTLQEVKAKSVDGVNIDYEGLDGSCGMADPYWAQHAMTSFVQKMRAGLGSSYYLSVDSYASSAADGYGFFDVVGMSAYVDSFFVMAYDLEYSNYRRPPANCFTFCLGPTGPLAGYYYNDTAVSSQYIAAVGASKVILGVPYYGRKACVGAAVPNAYPTSSVVADSYLDAAGEASYYEVKAGTYAVHRDANSAGAERWDTWYNTTLNCTRELYWDDAVSLGKKYDLVNTDKLRGVGLWNLNYGGGAPELWSALANHFSPCTSVTVAGSPASPQLVGTKVAFSATASGCPSPLYQLWILAPGSHTWQIVQPYSSTAILNWSTTGLGAGTYLYTVWARDASSKGTSCSSLGCDDVYFPATAYTLSSACTSVTDSASPPTASVPGTTVTFTASAAGCVHPLYQFWILAPGSHIWQIQQPFSSTATFKWHTTGLSVGSYLYTVWVRDATSAGISCGNLGCRDAYFPATGYSLTTQPCTSVTDSVMPSSSQKSGTAITFTASASGCPHPLYQFWILTPGSHIWQIKQAYSSTATFNWQTTGLPAGSYLYTVWVRDASSTGTGCGNLGCDDAYFPATAYMLSSPCKAVTDTAAPPTASTRGTKVTFTASASGCSRPLYQFWILAPGSHIWQVVQAYSSAATFNWNTTGLPAGGYLYTVWVRDASSTGTTCGNLGCQDAYFPASAYRLS
jgi:spore germination protein YaaH